MKKSFEIEGNHYSAYFFRKADLTDFESGATKLFAGDVRDAGAKPNLPGEIKAEILANFGTWNYVAVYAL